MTAQVEARPYAWPMDGAFNPRTTALVIIDMQKDFCSPGGYLSSQGYSLAPILSLIPRLTHLLATFRTHSFPIYHTREGHRPDLSTLSPREASRSKLTSGLGIGDPGPLGRLLIRGEVGHDIIPELYPLPSEPIVDKPGRSAFAHTDFELMLRIKGIKNLVVCGVTTDVCVGSTVREGNDRGFDCVVVGDACAASEGFLHDAALESVVAEGGIFGAVATMESILKALGEEMPEHLKEK
ncbi:Isochorismatase-like hydrolase [Glarea lozoyensis ATCC 20868]|uniref:Isochorismatase-like hydrolase n=2 Tax=Glarea lozoyensis TaxID=101852 RepID=S3D3F1_GLAL2|nr:Isochorismatase-like hydrolase [Glarea lozoyensis ATCC 20868]EHK99895.1 putative Peroxyureidoacrylate/ureidoacrylate amidohydrolase RutB [Glarea lozoyensis 74030]EPE33017.1 Isochorismatase-like hydrolase [Glarea lozoyensis ATCC 20868]